MCTRSWWARPVLTLASIIAYFVVAGLVFGYGEGWSLLDSIYFATVVSSTVGYGDIHPTSAGTRVATVLLAFVGITLIFSQVAWAMANAFMPAAQWMRSKLEAWHPPEVVKVEGLDGHSTEIRVPSAAGLYYVLNLAPVVGLWLALQLLFAGVLCVAQPMPYELALCVLRPSISSLF